MRHKCALILLLLLMGARLVVAEAASSPSSSPPDQTAAKNAPGTSDYVGSDACRTCHEDQFNRFKRTVMGKVFLNGPRTPVEKQVCESCHGPGKAHVEAGGGKDTVVVRFAKDSRNTAEEQNAACLQCHAKGNRLFWRGSQHESRGLKCVDCHEVMQTPAAEAFAETRFTSALTDVKQLKKTQPEVCLQCHQMRRAQLQRSSHMPFREGKVTCTSCHNPHGTPNPKLLIQSTLNENCYSCHAERRGPFLWEHPPVLENCGNCHEPHGSTNPQLLKVRAPRLCNQCHINSGHPAQPFAVFAPNGVSPAGFATRILNRGCTNCHAQIHGSNHPSGMTFLR